MDICYRLEKNINNKFLFNHVNATYVIHLENNGRLKNIKTQLNNIPLTKDVYILFNKGFKKCNKEKYINKPPLDLVDAFFFIFFDAYLKNYENILILEDDFIFSQEIFNINVRYQIDNFLEKYNNLTFCYYLGCLPYIQIKTFQYYNILLLSSGTHSVIYNKNFIEYIILQDKRKIIDWDVYLNQNYIKRFIYYKPICYQIFIETNNSKYWYNPFYLADLIKLSHKYLEVNIKPEPGFSIMYFFSCLIFIIFLIIFLIFILFLIIKFNKRLKKK